MNGLERGKELRARFTEREIWDLENVTNHIGLKLQTWPLTADVLYAVVGNQLVVPEGLTRHWRRWAIANGIAHWKIHPKLNEEVDRVTPMKRATMRFQASAFAFHLLVDVDEADRWWMTEPKAIAGYYGIPEEIVDAYQTEWLLPFAVTPAKARWFAPEELTS